MIIAEYEREARELGIVLLVPGLHRLPQPWSDTCNQVLGPKQLQEVRQSQWLWVAVPVCMADTVSELQGVRGWLRGHSNWENLVLFASLGLLEIPSFLETLGVSQVLGQWRRS